MNLDQWIILGMYALFAMLLFLGGLAYKTYCDWRRK
jgi:hypothetical protein